MRRSLAISGTAHAVLLLWGLVAFAARPSEAPPAEALPVEFVSATQFSQLTAGVKNAPKPIENAKQLADKVGDPKPVKELAPKAVEKPEIRTDSAPPPEPKAETKTRPKSAEKSDPKPEQKAEPKPAERAEKPKDKPKPDQVADELKKDEPKKPPKPEKKAPPEFKPDQIAEQLKRDEAKKPPRPAPKFDADQVAALLDHREPQRQLASADTLNGVASLGASTGHAAHLSQSELDALRAKLISLWNPPAAVSTHPDQYIVAIRIRLARDHRLVGQPEVLTGGQGPLFEATRDSAVRAIIQGQPYDMLSLTTYDQWKEIDINFDPREVFGG
jgi:outer membrane biosynthesis protein TonB